MILTLGYGDFTPERFDAIVKAIAPDILIDARAFPSGRVKRGFARADLEARHPNYEYRGRELGGEVRGGCYWTRAGIERLVSDAMIHPIVVFCACGVPGQCHRHNIIAKQIHDRVRVEHIYLEEPPDSSELVVASVTSTALDKWLALPEAQRNTSYPEWRPWP
jgi:uncharacterized protein (DUF488 family)